MASIGVLTADGIFVGQCSPTDRDGKSLSMTFNVFAAPRDLPEKMTYNDTVKYISELKDWHGFDGTHYANDTEIYAALKDGSYNDGWIIPTLYTLRGNNVNSSRTMLDNIHPYRDKFNVAGDPERAFKTVVSGRSDFPGFYWSSAQSQSDPDWVLSVRLLDGDERFESKGKHRLTVS